MNKTLVEFIALKYQQAFEDIEEVKNAGPQSPQERYDWKKSLRKGKIHQRQTAGFDKMRHEMEVEHRYVLRGVQEALDFIKNIVPEEEYLRIEKEIGDVQKAIEKDT